MTPTLRNLVTLSNSTAAIEITNQGVQVGLSTNQFAAWRFGHASAETDRRQRQMNTWYHGAYTLDERLPPPVPQR